jgi:FAD/FMN-containing dehydrogenase
VWADEQQHSDLFWAIRGGGGNFGVVTLFEFRLHPVGPDVLSGLIVFPLEQAKAVLTNYREVVEQMPEEMAVWGVLRKAPPLPFLPTEVHGKEILALAVCHVGDVEAGQREFEKLRQAGTPYGEHVGVQPYAAWQQAFDPLLAPGARNYWKSNNLSTLSDEAIDAVIDYAGKLPSPHCEVFLALLGGEASRPAPDAIAYAQRDAKFVLNVHARWEDASDDQACIAWAREFFGATAPYATGGVYVNFLGQDEPTRITAAYGPNYDRLAKVKNTYDPENLFHLNQNIKPVA